MAQDARDEGIALPGQPLVPLFVEKHVLPVSEQRHVGVHSVARQTVDRFGHKGGVKAVPLGNSLHRQLEGHDLVRTVQSGGILEVDLVLAGRHLVVGRLNLIPHLLQGQADASP